MISKCQKECLATSKGILYYDLGHGNVGNTSIHWLDVWLCSVLGVTLRWYAHWTFVLHLCSHRNAGTFSTEECVLFRCILTGRMQVFFLFCFSWASERFLGLAFCVIFILQSCSTNKRCHCSPTPPLFASPCPSPFCFATLRWRQDTLTDYLVLSRINVKRNPQQVTDPWFHPI